MIHFYGYKKCSTSNKAEKQLLSEKIKFDFIDITSSPPSERTLKECLSKSGLPINKLINTSGLVYRSTGMKEKIKSMK